MNENQVLEILRNWGNEKKYVRAMILTGSRVDTIGKVDIFSDYDVEIFTNDISTFLNDDWLSFFGEVMVFWPLKPSSTFDERYITRLVLFKNKIRIDFQITDKKNTKPLTYDNGYKILVDKDNIEKLIKRPTYKEFVIKKPSEDEYLALVNDFWWDVTYVAKKSLEG